MDIRIDRPTFNRKTTEENMALMDKWVADTSDKLNTFITQVNRRMVEYDKIIKEQENNT